MVPQKLKDKIGLYEKEGHDARKIVMSIQKSMTWPDVGFKVEKYLQEGYSPEHILRSLKEAPSSSEKKGVLSQFERIGEIYSAEEKAGREKIGEFIEKPSGKSLLRAGLGGLQYVTSPITALTRGAIREPVEGIPKSLGAPDIVIKLVGEAAEQGAYFLPYGALVKQAIKGGEVLRKTEEGVKVGREISKEAERLAKKEVPMTKPPLKFPTQPSAELAEELAATGIKKPVVSGDLQKQVADAASDILSKAPPEEKKRIGQQVIDLVHSNQLSWEELPSILKKYDITPEEFSQRLVNTYSEAGRTLQRLSVVAQRVKKELKNNPEAQKFLDKFVKELPEPSGWDRFADAARRLESTRRGLLVTQLATMMRNVTSQAARVTIGSVDDTLQAVIRATIGGEGNLWKQVGESFDHATAFLNRFSPSARKRLEDILSSEAATLSKSKLLSAPVHEVTVGGKVTKVLNAGNNLQEMFFRKLSFEAKLSQLLERAGMDIKNINPNKIPKGVIEEAVDHALTMTFSAMPKSKAGQRLVRGWSNQPLLTATIQPFPRFAANALTYMRDFSPIGFIKALNPGVIGELAGGNPERFAESASKAILGTMQLGMAMWLRNGEHRGEKWYEVKVGGKTYDTRSYAPLISPYMLIAEGMSHPEKLDAADWAGAAVGLNRVSGTLFVLTDILRSGTVESTKETFEKMAGAYLGSFSVPLKTFKDLYASVRPEAAVMRDVKERPVIGPFLKNIPGLSETLPASVSPLKSEPPRTESPLLRQLTGLSERTKTLIEKEVDDLGIGSNRIYPRTGIPEADREISKMMGPVIEKLAPAVIGSERYKNDSQAMKRVVWGFIFSQARSAARKRLAETRPDLYSKIRWEGMSDDLKEILGEKLQGKR